MFYHNILRFWFHELTPQLWWIKSNSLDALIARRFRNIHSQAIAGELYQWRDTPHGALAEIIILDQFFRNIFRDTPKAFAYDSMALTLAQTAINKHSDSQLDNDEKSFLYMPFMHCESKLMHLQAIKLFSQSGLENNLDFEHKHKEIIDRFGRYPHRNEILGRISTAKEIEFLKEPNSSF